ncbi:MAG: hypothetical protein JXX28_13860 [Deltaproteobacteria bacterium]|nr:hypothetical protein [Deltaproteobacteria bacterium]
MRFALGAPRSAAGVPVWDDEEALETLDRLVARAEEAHHLLLLLDLDALEKSRWFLTTRPRLQTLLLDLRAAATAAAWQAPRSDLLVRSAADAQRALRIANTPLVVLVENRLRDGALVDAAIRLYGSEAL